MQVLKDMLKKYQSLVREDRTHDADPFVVALAKSIIQQHTISDLRTVVITEEKIRGNKITIPFVCRQYGIDAVEIIEMFRTEKWRF